MKIKSLILSELNIPFKISFKHSSATRTQTESVVVIAESDSGLKGFGEGCPRPYVTGETLKTAHRFFNTHRDSLLNITRLEDLQSWISENKKAIDANPAAWCAIELALLDILGREAGQSIEGLLGVPELSGEFRYTAVLGINPPDVFAAQLQKYLELGFRDFKIKISGNIDEDRARIDLLKAQTNPDLKVRLDANNLWRLPNKAIDHVRQLDFPFFAIEEPLQTEQYDSSRRIFETLSIPIILDESFIRKEQFSNLESAPQAWIINLRISKMGGLLRSLAIAEVAKGSGIPVIVGAQVGETSLLTRAALTVVNAFPDNTVAQEGAFGTHLLERDITATPLMFGTGGKLPASAISPKPGLGVDCNKVETLTNS